MMGKNVKSFSNTLAMSILLAAAMATTSTHALPVLSSSDMAVANSYMATMDPNQAAPAVVPPQLNTTITTTTATSTAQFDPTTTSVTSTTAAATNLLPDSLPELPLLPPPESPLPAADVPPPGPIDNSTSSAVNASPTIKISVGANTDDTNIPRGAAWTGYDIRPTDNGQDIQGYVLNTPWSQDSVNQASVASSVPASNTIEAGTITNDSDMQHAIDVTASVKGTYMGGLASAEASFGYSGRTSQKSHLASGWTYGSAIVGGDMLEPWKLELDARALKLLQTDVMAFIDSYGTHYINERAYGCEAQSRYSLQCSSQSASEDISASLHASFNEEVVSVTADLKTKISTYSDSNICDFSASVTTYGFQGGVNPSESQMLDPTFMNNYWNSFKDQCSPTSSGTMLVFVRLGNWLDVNAIADAVRINDTATHVLKFYSKLSQDDVEAIALGQNYYHKVHTSVLSTNQSPAYLNPMAKTGFFDRETRAPLPLVSGSYWDALPQQHADLLNKLPSSTWVNFFNDTIAVQNGTTSASDLALAFYTNAKQLYNTAIQTYAYTYTGVTVVMKGPQTSDGTTMTSNAVTLDFAQKNDCKPQGIGTPVPCLDSPVMFSASGVQGKVSVYIWNSIWDESEYMLAAQFYSAKSSPWIAGIVQAEMSQGVEPYDNHDILTGDSLDLTPSFHAKKLCQTCSTPITLELTILYTMPDVSYAPVDPYNRVE